MPPAAPRTDEVDRIVAGWAQARPDLDTSPLEVFSRISRLARHLESARRAAFTATGLEGWEFDVLSALRRAGDEPLSPGALMRQTLVTSGTMSTRLEKLASRGLVRREKDPHDGRAVRVSLEPAGIEKVDAAMEILLESEREVLGGGRSDTAGAESQRAHLQDPAGTAADGEMLARALRELLLPFETEN
ncbi:MarR family winged helix-turn-helix transcriptional regulator [Brachybacterium subflavum]|uniref:MarR family winged helix-turn-helix transcriptional regulator n=1 Tax=Brachybacterium subflavum TaxID=2585206 RepID=UPI0012662D93|nr:MarR family winged helix-turn-helix transcriptional regulator [Brachybacterium subflavum]